MRPLTHAFDKARTETIHTVSEDSRTWACAHDMPRNWPTSCVVDEPLFERRCTSTLVWEISSLGRGTLPCIYICVIEARTEGHGV